MEVWEQKLAVITNMLLETWQRKEKKRLFTDNRVVKKEILFFVDAINNVL